MEDIQRSTANFLQDIQSLSPETQKEAIDKKIADLVRQQLRLRQSSSPSTVPVPDTSLLHKPQEPTDLHFIETLLQTLRTKRAELEHIPTKEELESLFHEAMSQPTKTEQGKALVKFFKTCIPFRNIEILKEILQTEPNFKLDELLYVYVFPGNPPPLMFFPRGRETLLTIAVQQHDLEMVRLLTALGANTETTSSSLDFPLMIAINNKDRAMVQTLLESGANIHQIDSSGWTPLTKAVVNRDPEMVKKLKALGADINQINGKGWTPLSRAVENRDPEMVRTLVALGADVNSIRPNPLLRALRQKNQQMVELLEKECHADPRIAYQLIDCNQTALLTGLSGRVPIQDSQRQYHSIELEGGLREFATQHLLESTSSFFSSHLVSQDELPQESREHILTILHHTNQIATGPQQCSDDEIVAQIHRGDTVAISSGWEDHGISIIFSNNEIFICNRGEGTKEYAIMAHQCLSTTIKKEFISNIRKANLANAKEFDSMLQQHGILGAVLPEDCFDMRLQKVGNCSRANTKPIVQVLLYLELKKLKPTLSAQELHKETNKIYKLWSAQVRVNATRKYALSPIEEIVPEMLTKLVEKTVSCRSLTPTQKEELLTLLQQKIKEKTDLLEHAGDHFPDTEEIKAIKAAEATHDMGTLEKLLWKADAQHNTLLFQRILSAYRPEDLPHLHEIARKIAPENMIEGLQRLQSSDTVQEKEKELSDLLTLAIENEDPTIVLILRKLGANIN